MDLVPYVDKAGFALKREAIYDKAKKEGRQLSMTEAFEVKALDQGVDIMSEVQIFKANDNKSSTEEKIREYLEEKTGLGKDFMRIQADRMAVRLFIPERVYKDFRSAGVPIPSNEVVGLLAAHKMDHQMRFKIHLNEEMWVPIISTYAKLFEKNKLQEFDWWINELLRIRDVYLSLTQKRLNHEDKAEDKEATKDN